MNNEFLITAAGGNGTAIRVVDAPLERIAYAALGSKLGDKLEPYGAEQAGFLVPTIQHFEMSGGEFCGNASRSAAVIFSDFGKEPMVDFTVSGFDGVVSASVRKLTDTKYQVRCTFPGLPTDCTKVVLSTGQEASVVDLGGIVHVVIEDTFPDEATAYEQAHHGITRELGLGERDAVGVVWITQTEDAVHMHPVVWVRAVDTFFYETSCGSGTIAVGKVTERHSIVQPSGQSIDVEISSMAVALESEMEVVPVTDDMHVDDSKEIEFHSLGAGR